MKEANQKVLIFGTASGLGDRLFSFAYGARLARILKRKPFFWWPSTAECEAEFRDIFEEIECAEDICGERDQITLDRVYYINKFKLKRKENEDFYCVDCDPSITNIFIDLDLPFFLCREKFFLNDKDYRNKINEEIKSNINKITLVKRLRDEIKKFSRKFDENTVSLHLRRTDLMNWLYGGMPGDQEVIRMLKGYIKRNPLVKFYLATDSKKTAFLLKKELPGRIVTYPKKYWVEKRDKNKRWFGNVYRPKKSIEDSVIELHLLSKNKKFIRFEGYSGNFSKLPQILNQEQEVILLKEKKSFWNAMIGAVNILRRRVKRHQMRISEAAVFFIGSYLKKNFPVLYYKLKRFKK